MQGIFERRKINPNRKWIMISGPYTTGAKSPEDLKNNLVALNELSGAIYSKGYIPIIGANMSVPMMEFGTVEGNGEDFMMSISLGLALKCDAVLRVGGPSIGGDDEMNLIKSRGGKVYWDIDDIPEAM